MKHKLLSIVVPVYNERDSILELISTITKAFADFDYEYIFVDDGSSDGSFEKLKSVQKSINNPLTILRFQRNHGKSAALSEGFANANGDIVVTLDADLQDDPNEAVRLVKKLSDETDMIVGWRKERNDNTRKLHISHLFNRAVSILYGVRFKDMNSGLKVMRKHVATELSLYGELHRFIPVLAHLKGFRVVEIPVIHHGRKYGKSKYGIGRIFSVFDLITTLFLSGFGTRPLRVFGPAGLLLVVIGSAFLVYLTLVWLSGESIGTRPLLLLGVLFVLFGFQLFSTGLLGELIISVNSKKIRPYVAEVLKNT